MEHADFSQSFAQQKVSRHAGQRASGGFGQKRRSTRCPRVDFQHVDHVVFDGELDVHQAYQFQCFTQTLGDFPNGIHVLGSDLVRRNNTGRVSRMNAGFLDVLKDARDDDVLPVSQAVHVGFDGVFQKLVDEEFALIGHFQRFLGKAVQTVFVVNDSHGSSAEDVGGT